jgi:TetR/AcrR family transcriptional regulator, transcriptional repressor for nem operon
MRQPEVTKTHLIEEASKLFNTKGYKATSISDITSVTNLTKGAIYRHFANKEELEVASLKALFEKVKFILGAAVKNENTAPAKLKALFNAFEQYALKPFIKGGCPLLNVATESDDSNPVLKKIALDMLAVLKQSVEKIINNGIKYKQLKKQTNAETFSVIAICSLEGSIMTSKLARKNNDLKIVINHLNKLVDDISI